MSARLATVALVASVVGASVAHADPAPKPRTETAPGVELVTFGAGASLFEAFGHAALCLTYEDASYNVCFNYGVTDYDASASLVWNFIRGTQVFWSEPSNYAAMIEVYKEDDRDIYVQQIATTDAQARAIEDHLWHDADPAHRTYVYDHATNNCATRLRDLLDTALGGALAHDTTMTDITLRQVEERGFAASPLLIATADFVLGREMDVPLTRWQAMFLPDFLRSEVSAKLDALPTQIHARHGPPPPIHPSQTGRIAFALLALVTSVPLALWSRSRPRLTLWIATVPLALLGITVWALATLSPIGLVRWNEALIVLLPLDLALPLFTSSTRRLYARARVLTLIGASIACTLGVLHQPLWLPILVAALPLATIGFIAVAEPDRMSATGADKQRS